MNYLHLLITLKRLAADLMRRMADEQDHTHRSEYQHQLTQIRAEIKRIEGMRSYMR